MRIKGNLVTSANISHVTKVGNFGISPCASGRTASAGQCHKAEMSFVGTRPEVPRHTEQYSPEMMATLLLPQCLPSKYQLQGRGYYHQSNDGERPIG